MKLRKNKQKNKNNHYYLWILRFVAHLIRLDDIYRCDGTLYSIMCADFLQEATESLKKLRIFDESEEVQIINELEVVDTEQKQLGPSNYWDDMSNTNG
jgi:hypothetical protein